MTHSSINNLRNHKENLLPEVSSPSSPPSLSWLSLNLNLDHKPEQFLTFFSLALINSAANSWTGLLTPTATTKANTLLLTSAKTRTFLLQPITLINFLLVYLLNGNIISLFSSAF